MIKNMTSFIKYCRFFALCCVFVGAQTAETNHKNTTDQQTSRTYPAVTITTTMGEITAELYPDSAPKSVHIFLELANGTRAWHDLTAGTMVKKPYYDGLTFHRVIDGFMIQGGDQTGTGAGGAGFTFSDEFNGVGLGLDREFVLNNGRMHPKVAYMQADFMSAIVRPRLEAMGLGPMLFT